MTTLKHQTVERARVVRAVTAVVVAVAVVRVLSCGRQKLGCCT